MVDALDLQQEGRLSVVESKVDRILPMVEDLHADMTSRNARWAFLGSITRYGFWIVAGAISIFGMAHGDAVATWMLGFPH